MTKLTNTSTKDLPITAGITLKPGASVEVASIDALPERTVLREWGNNPRILKIEETDAVVVDPTPAAAPVTTTVALTEPAVTASTHGRVTRSTVNPPDNTGAA